MLSVLLMILKIIGIILAVILGLVIVLLLLVLFVPVRYDVLAKYYDKVPYVKANVTALFRLVRFRLEYSDELVYRAKVLFFTVFSSDGEEVGEKVMADSKKSGEKSSKAKKKSDNVFDEEPEDDSFFAPERLDDEKRSENQAVIEKADPIEDASNPEETEKKGFFERIVDKIMSVINSIKSAILGLKEKIVSIIDSIRQKKEDLSEKLNSLYEMINDPDNRELVKFIWEQIKYLLRAIKPKKGRLYVHYGMEDPETTGKIAMYLAVLYGMMGLDINILPDFEQQVMEGELFIKGRLRLITLVIIIIRALRNKQFKKIVLKK